MAAETGADGEDVVIDFVNVKSGVCDACGETECEGRCDDCGAALCVGEMHEDLCHADGLSRFDREEMRDDREREQSE